MLNDASENPVHQLEVLASPQGQQLLGRLARETHSSDARLRLTVGLRRDYPPEVVHAALTQHDLRTAGSAKFTRAAEMFFTRVGLEQASSELVARHRARRYIGYEQLADLCCGIGGDLVALAVGHQVLAVDRDPLHLAMSTHNADVYGVGANVTARVADVREVDLAGIDAVFIDPSRRSATRRLRPGAGEPPLDWCFTLTAQVAAAGIKAAPGIPHSVIPDGWEAEFVADCRDLKEAVLWSPAMAEHPRRATILPAGQTLVPVPGDEVTVGEPGAFLLDPNPAVTRAGLVQDLARRLGVWKIDPRIAFLSTGSPLRTPFARTLQVLESAPWNEKLFARRLHALDIGAADIRRRGLAGDVNQIHRRLKLHGHRRATVVITRVNDRPWGLICTDLETPATTPTS